MAIARFSGDKFVGTEAERATATGLPGSTFYASDSLKVYQWVGGDWEQIDVDKALEALTDVVITAASSGHALFYNGTNWVNRSITESDISDLQGYLTEVALNDVTDVEISAVADEQVLAYNASESRWENINLASIISDIESLNDINDVNITTPSVGEVLFYDGTNWANRDITEADISDLGDYVESSNIELGISNSAGTEQFTVPLMTENVQFAASGDASITFTPASNRITFSATNTDTTYTAGDGLALAANEFSVDLRTNSGLIVDPDGLGVASSIAGTRLSFLNGVLSADATNLGISGTGDTRTITSSTGSNVSIPTATETDAGFMSIGDKEKVNKLLFDIDDYIDLSIIPPDAKSSKVVADIAARDAIVTADRFEGLRVHVLDASDDSTVDSGSAGYILTAGLANTDWEKTYESESLDIDVYPSVGQVDDIQLAASDGEFKNITGFSWDDTNTTLFVPGSVRIKEDSAPITPSHDEATMFIETEVDGSDTITRVMQRLGNGDNVIIASYIQ